MDDVDRVHVVDGERHLREDRQRVVLLEGPLREQVLEQLAAAEALHHDVHVLLVAARTTICTMYGIAELLREGALHPQRLVHLVVLELGEREHLDRHLRRAAPLRLPQVHCRLRAEPSSFLRVYRVEMSLSVTSASEVARASGSIASAISSSQDSPARAKEQPVFAGVRETEGGSLPRTGYFK